MRRISRKQRCTPAILSWQGILESGKCQRNGEHQDRRPRRQQNPRSRRRQPRDQRRPVRCGDERHPDLAIVLLTNVPGRDQAASVQDRSHRAGRWKNAILSIGLPVLPRRQHHKNRDGVRTPLNCGCSSRVTGKPETGPWSARIMWFRVVCAQRQRFRHNFRIANHSSRISGSVVRR